MVKIGYLQIEKKNLNSQQTHLTCSGTTPIQQFIMIKSSDGKSKNTYRVLKLLATKDYLALNHLHLHFILTQSHVSPHPHCQYPIPSINPTSSIIHSQETITVDYYSYQAFEVGQDSPVWLKDVEKKRVLSSKFISRLFREAVINILGQLLLLDSKVAGKYLDVRNFWLVNGRICLILMSRASIESRLKRTQTKRSYSQETSVLSQVIDQQMSIIKKFAQILFQALEMSLFAQKSISQTHRQVKQLLLKILSKRLSYSDLCREVAELDSTSFSVKSKRSSLLNINKHQLLKRRNTLQPAVCLKQVDGSQSRYFTPLKVKGSCKTTFLRQQQTKNSTQTIEHQRFSRLPLLSNNETRYLGSQRNSASQTSFLSPVRSVFQTNPARKRFVTVKENQRQRAKYLNWMRDKKMSFNLVEKVNQLSILARQKFKQNCARKDTSQMPGDTSHLVTKLFEKTMRFRAAKYHQVQKTNTQQIAYGDLPSVGNILSESERNRILSNLQKNYIGEDEQQLKAVAEEKVKHSSELNKEVSPQIIQKADNISNNYDYVAVEQQSLNQRARIVEDKCNEVNGQPLSSHSKPAALIQQDDFVLPQKSNLGQKKHPKVPKQKMKKVRRTSTQIQQNEDQIQTISLVANTKNRLLQPHQPPQVELKPRSYPSLAPQTVLRASPSDRSVGCKHKEANLSRISASVREFVTLINVLGDICVKTVQEKRHLSGYEWMKSVFFLYERFFFERTKLLDQLLANRSVISRSYQHIAEEDFRIWAQGSEKAELVELITKQNAQISATYEHFSKKTLEQGGFQPMIQNFIKKRDQLLATKGKDLRHFISKYAVALIINEFDEAIARKEKRQEVKLYVSRCLFGLRILAELDGVQTGRERVELEEYSRVGVKLEGEGEWVQQLYGAYYPEEEKQ